MAKQQGGKALGKGAARHDGIATGIDGLDLEIALDVGEESNDGGAALELGLDLGDQGERLGVQVVEVDDDERGTLVFRSLRESGKRFFIRPFEEADLDACLARDFVDLSDEEKVIDEAIDARGSVFTDGSRSVPYGVHIASDIAVDVAIANVNGGGRSVGDIPVGSAVAVIHRADKSVRLALLILTATASLAVSAAIADTVAWVGLTLELLLIFLFA